MSAARSARSGRAIRREDAKKPIVEHALQSIVDHDWAPERYGCKTVEPEAREITRRAAVAAGMPADAIGACAAWAASPASTPVPHRDVTEHVRQVVEILDGLTAAEQRTVLNNAAQAVQCQQHIC
ncbi:hypothetical protein [Actinomadura verrucosospora]|uniref:Uncharacterized protein n=1 Tax=Actinomadura verrucosospora TaxID=46165 RepID=A0A7D3VQS9_ACTVE|nr:hypothetical protein [Actinomadura verrucosospora]QKG20070.1 hypothetical protein ACTIVE_1706 [Actinomadura verrucosospora]